MLVPFDFVNYSLEWPSIPPNSIVTDALSRAALVPGTLALELQVAEQRSNAWTDAQSAGHVPSLASP